jgi:aryl-alcohol dehydrogenase-like predicted oxidoreductase
MENIDIARKLIIGTQTFGADTKKDVAFNLLNIGHQNGFLRIDTAERYPFPETRESVGNTELIIGEWLRTRKVPRESICISTKVSGRSDNDWFEEGGRLTKKRIIDSVNSSLKRLGVDYIDTYYLHWPDRYTNIFGRKYYNPDIDSIFISIEDQHDALSDLINSGKICSYALSNETPWGLMKFIESASGQQKYKPKYIQNEYSLLDRRFEIALSEISIRESIPLIAYSPLAFGLLTGKYSENRDCSDFRLVKNAAVSRRYLSEVNFSKADIVNRVCKEFGVPTAKFALNFISQNKFVGGVVVGARVESQLEEIINYFNYPISFELVNDIRSRIESFIDI